MPQSNFAFLSAVAPSIAQLGAQAEAYLKRDPHTTLLKLRLLGEQLAKACAGKAGLRPDEIDGQHELINALRQASVVSPLEARLLHEVRRQGNQAAHDGHEDKNTAEQCLRHAHSLCASIGIRVWQGVQAEPYRPLAAISPLDETESAVRVLTAQLSDIAKGGSKSSPIGQDETSNVAAELKALARELASRERELKLARESAARDKALEERLAGLETLFKSAQKSLAATVKAERTEPPHAIASATAFPSEPLFSAPPCPRCGEETTRRVAKKGPTPGQAFWGCTAYPGCRGTLPLEQGILQQVPDDTSEPENAKFAWVPGEWRHDTERPGWITEYLEIGGRLRALDPIGTLSPELQCAASHASLHRYRGRLQSTDQVEGPPSWVGAIGRRLALRGSRPPVDLRVEMAILAAAGLQDSLEAALHPGDLARSIRMGTPVPGPIRNSVCEAILTLTEGRWSDRKRSSKRLTRRRWTR